MPSVATLISRAAARYLSVGGQTVARELARAAAREFRGGAEESARAVSSVPAHGRFARGVFVVWLAGLALFALVVVNVDLFLPPGRAVAVFQLAVGAILLVEGLGLVVERFPFRRLLGARLAARSHRGGGRLQRAGWPRLVGAALTVLGIVWIGAGVLEVLRGALALL